jgi:HSP20 family protein
MAGKSNEFTMRDPGAFVQVRIASPPDSTTLTLIGRMAGPRTEEEFMNLMRWEPFRETDEFFRNLSAPMFGKWPQLLGDTGTMKVEWAPVVDIKETEKEFVVNAELPGVKREDVKVSLEDGVLMIEGERRQELDVKGEKTHRVERFYGKFCRSFTLPEYADANAIHAESKDGVLSVYVPKLKIEKREPRQITIQ